MHPPVSPAPHPWCGTPATGSPGSSGSGVPGVSVKIFTELAVSVIRAGHAVGACVITDSSLTWYRAPVDPPRKAEEHLETLRSTQQFYTMKRSSAFVKHTKRRGHTRPIQPSKRLQIVQHFSSHGSYHAGREALCHIGVLHGVVAEKDHGGDKQGTA